MCVGEVQRRWLRGDIRGDLPWSLSTRQSVAGFPCARLPHRVDDKWNARSRTDGREVARQGRRAGCLGSKDEMASLSPVDAAMPHPSYASSSYAYEFVRRLRRAGAPISSIAYDPGFLPNLGMSLGAPAIFRTQLVKFVPGKVGMTMSRSRSPARHLEYLLGTKTLYSVKLGLWSCPIRKIKRAGSEPTRSTW